MRRAAYDLSVQLRSREDNTTSPSAANGSNERGPRGELGAVRVPEANEMEYLDVFEFFNYPLVMGGVTNGNFGSFNLQMDLPHEMTNGSNGVGGEAAARLKSPTFAMPTREGDWLGFQPPHE